MVSTEFKGVGLHYTAFRDAIREDSRQTTPSRGVTPRKKFAVKANVESRVNRAIAILKGEKEEPEQWSMDWSPLKKFMHMKEEDVCQLVVDGKIRFVMQGDKTLGLWVNDIREQLVPGYHKLPERYCRLL